jgi:ParB/RepB/Spo0J family partition protein
MSSVESANTTKFKLKTIEIAKIRENPVALRSVNKQDEQYLGLVDSIRSRGVLNPILVREVKDAETGEVYFGLVDGLQRFTASQDAGRTEIPAQVIALTDAEVLEAQIITNVHRVETKPVEYSKQLMRILAGNPTMTLAELAGKLNKSPAWIGDRLALVKLSDTIQPLVDDGKINLSNAYALAKLPPDEQANFVDRAMTMPPQEFVPTVNVRVKEIRDAKRQGRDASPSEFQPVPHLQKLAEIKGEYENPTVGPVLVAESGAKTAEEGFRLGVAWALHMDPRSVEAQKQKDAERRAAAEAEKAKRKAERDAKKAQEAASVAASV